MAIFTLPLFLAPFSSFLCVPNPSSLLEYLRELERSYRAKNSAHISRHRLFGLSRNPAHIFELIYCISLPSFSFIILIVCWEKISKSLKYRKLSEFWKKFSLLPTNLFPFQQNISNPFNFTVQIITVFSILVIKIFFYYFILK